ncbi:hypothetical protein [Helicobacter trogontum]|uniref:Plasmid replication protein RepL domain-containing protein n=1 Tax=Helicobacter trogontum TaxID=50960 RepID=A0A4U8TBL0_9HELI|nr:hypothetical protein [Helicobacter trogontum]MCI5787177.1 hypothetical protein [Helicobacter trogontum]MDY5184783.1 hypothetical protein [Helicobacter trogontum]TLD96007.1 hypothetical protein LS80_008955 [Helicobacter trogontum]
MGSIKVLEHTNTKIDNMGNKEVEYKLTEAKNMDRENYIQLYIDKFQFIAKLEGMTIKILSLMISNCVTYNDNELNLSSMHRARIMQKLNIKNAQITRALRELCEKGFLRKEAINSRLITYKLNPNIFGYDSFNTLKKQKMNFQCVFDFDNLTITEKVKMETEYENDKKYSWDI